MMATTIKTILTTSFNVDIPQPESGGQGGKRKTGNRAGGKKNRLPGTPGRSRFSTHPARKPMARRRRTILTAEEPAFIMTAVSTMRLCAVRQTIATMVTSRTGRLKVAMTAMAL